MDSNTQTILIVFVALTGIAVLLQACVLLAIFISLRKTAKALLEVTGDIKGTVIPLVHSTQELLERLSPQIITVTGGLSELTETLRKQSAGVSFSVAEIMGRVNRQTQRLDVMMTTGLNSVERAGAVLESAVAAPVRQANGIFAALKAVVGTYRSTVPSHKSPYPDPDQEKFI